MQNAAFVSRPKACRLRVKMLCSVHQQSPAPGSIGCLSPSVDLPPAKAAVTPKVISFPCDRCTQWLVKGGVTTHRPPGLESGHLKVTLPLPPPSPLLSSFQMTPPRSLPNWHMAANPFQVYIQGIFLETGVQLEQWSKKYNEAVFWFPFLQNERGVHKGKRQPGKRSKESDTQTKEKAANWGCWSTETKSAEKEWAGVRIFKKYPLNLPITRFFTTWEKSSFGGMKDVRALSGEWDVRKRWWQVKVTPPRCNNNL